MKYDCNTDMKKNELKLVILALAAATAHLCAQSGWTPKYTVITPGSNEVNLVWATSPGYMYMFKATTNLAVPFAPATDFPTNLTTQTNYISLNVPTTGQARFFQLFAYDTHGPYLDDIWPADGACAIARQEPVTTKITSSAPLNLNSLRMTVAGQTVQWPDNRLSFATNYLTFKPGTNDFLGVPGEQVSVTLYVEDAFGYGTPQTWSFRIARPLTLRPNVVYVDTGTILGSGPSLTLRGQLNTNTFIYSFPGTISGLSDGMVLVNTNYSTTNNQSYARMVLTHMESPLQHNVAVTTRPAELGEIFGGSLRIKLPAGSLGTTNQAFQSKDVGCLPFGNLTLYQDGNVTLQTSPNSSICAQPYVDAGIDFADLCLPWLGCIRVIPDQVHFKAGLDFLGELALRLNTTAAWSSGQQSIPLGEVPLGVIPVFGVPIILSVPFDFNYEISAAANLDLTAGILFLVGGHIGFHAGIHGIGPDIGPYNIDGQGFQPIFTYSSAANVDAKAGIRAGIKISVADIVWVSAGITPYAEAKLGVFCWDPVDCPKEAEALLFAEIFGTLGVDLGDPNLLGPPGEYVAGSLQAGLDGDITFGSIFGGTTFSAPIIHPQTIQKFADQLGSCSSCDFPPPPPEARMHVGLPTGSHPKLLVLDGTTVPNQLAGHLWGRRVGNLFLPLGDDSHYHNTGGTALYIDHPQASDAGTYLSGTRTMGGFDLLETVVDLVPPAPADSSLSPYASLIWISPGTFLLGSPTNELERSADELQHPVTISRGFYLGAYEVSQQDFLQLTGTNPSQFQDTNSLPVENVTWAEATNYCALLTQRQLAAGLLPVGWAYRLPTEAEWEYACRGTNDLSGQVSPPQSVFPNGPALLGYMANFSSTNEYTAALGTLPFPRSPYVIGRTLPVGTYLPSFSGLHDLQGNVAEWVSDWYGAYPASSVTDPVGPATGTARVFRGGSWMDSGRNCRTASRASAPPDNRMPNVGFRVVLANF
jgi:formylglycine-generating enzyme required for sulfatase activity